MVEEGLPGLVTSMMRQLEESIDRGASTHPVALPMMVFVVP